MHVGTVIDPLAREDGGDEPHVQLAPGVVLAGMEHSSGHVGSEAEDARGYEEQAVSPPPRVQSSPVHAEVSARGGPEDLGATAGHPVRDRLLMRARGAGPAREAPGGAAQASSGDPSDPFFSPLDAELDRVGQTPTRPRPPAPLREGGLVLSANTVAAFTALFGLAAVASIFAIATHLDPRSPEVRLVLPSAAPALSSTPPAAPVEAAEPAAPAPALRPPRKRLPGPWRIATASEPGLRKLSGQIGREPFLRALQNAGLDKTQAYRVLAAFKGVKDLDKCKRTDAFEALVDPKTQRLTAFEYIVSKEDVYQAREGKDGLLSARHLDLAVELGRVSGAVLVSTNFGSDAERGGFESGLVAVVDKALSGHTGLSQVHPGDRFRIIAQEVTVLGEFARYAGVEALEYLSAGPDEPPLRVYYFDHGGERGYFDAKGRAPGDGGWRKPVPGAPITSKFNPHRMHPVLHKVMPHTGTDFGAPMGAAVHASSYGTISYIGPAGPSGNLVKIEHTGGIETGYAHLSRFEPGLKVGDAVKRLQVIGYVGSTGRSTGPHLHFTAKRNGEFFDAETLDLDALRVLPASHREAFEQVRQKLDALLDAIPLPPAPARPPSEAVAAATESSGAEGAEPGDEEAAEPVGAGTAPPSATGTGSAVAASPKPAREVQPPRTPPLPAAPQTPPVSVAASAPAPAPATGASPASRRLNSLYITDAELMKRQQSAAAGEVAP